MASKSSTGVISKGAIKKSITRNVSVPLGVSEKRRSIVKHPTTSDYCPKKISNCKEFIEKYQVPELNTALDLVKDIEKLKISKSMRVSSEKDLTPRTKAIVTHEITKKLNFPHDKPIYKGLIPINVNDSILLPEQRKPIRKKYTKKATKDPIPELSDFLTPIEPLKHILPLYDNPDKLRKPNNDNFEKIHELYVNFHPNF